MTDVEDLSQYVTELVANPAAVISVRDENSVYQWVNDQWVMVTDLSREDVIGRKPTDLTAAPVEQRAQFLLEDRKVVQQRRLVSINTYTVNGDPTRFMMVRVYVSFRGKKYIVEVSFVLGPQVIDAVSGWSSERIEYSFGEDLARSLLAIPAEEDALVEPSSSSSDSVGMLVWALYHRVMRDPELSPFFRHIDVVRVANHQMVMFAALIAGEPPPDYDLKAIHAPHHVTDAAFNKLLRHVLDVFISYGVSSEDSARVMVSLEKFRRLVVTEEG